MCGPGTRPPGMWLFRARGGGVPSSGAFCYPMVMSDHQRDESIRPWGFYEVLAGEDDHQVKRITVHPGSRMSLQKHRRREEHWVVVSGRALVTLDEEEIPLGTGGSVDIPREAAHRIGNPGDMPLVFVEVQRGDYFGEDDIIRLEDDYGRKGP
jgi:mannose-6-phosphate isomerase